MSEVCYGPNFLLKYTSLRSITVDRDLGALKANAVEYLFVTEIKEPTATVKLARNLTAIWSASHIS